MDQDHFSFGEWEETEDDLSSVCWTVQSSASDDTDSDVDIIQDVHDNDLTDGLMLKHDPEPGEFGQPHE